MTGIGQRPIERLTLREAQALAVIAQGIASAPPRRRVRMEDLRALVYRLGCVQLDTISVISRSHETVAFSRLGSYDVGLWDRLYEPDDEPGDAITEYWAHAAAIIPRQHLRLFRPFMERHRDRLAADTGLQHVRDAVVARIRDEGALASRHFDAPPDTATHAWDWYGTKPEREALAHLWTSGDLVLRRREKFQRIFDLPERVVPDLWEGEIHAEEWVPALARRALRALGVTTRSWLADYYRSGGKRHLSDPTVRRAIADLVATFDAVPITIDGIDEPAWMSIDLIPALDALRRRTGWPSRTVLLSPFDNLVWYRPRDEQLWGFHYRLECYTPAPKRIYGYYSLPILHRGRLVGRLDPSYDRRARLLTVKALHWEPTARPDDVMRRAVANAIGDLCVFLGTDRDRWVVAGADAPATLH